jgi:hypothetical protein
MSIEEIRQRAEAATEGPFEVSASPRHARVAVVNRKTKMGMRINLMSVADHRTPVLQLADAELLAHAREDILTLLGVVDGVQEIVESMRKVSGIAEECHQFELAGFLRAHADTFDAVLSEPSDG